MNRFFFTLSLLLCSCLQAGEKELSSSDITGLWRSTTYSLSHNRNYMPPEMLTLYSKALSCSFMLGSSKSDGDWICQTTPSKNPYIPTQKRLLCDQMALEILASYGDATSSAHLMRHAKTVYSPFSTYALNLLSLYPLNTYSPELFEHILALKRQAPAYFSPAALALVMRFPTEWTCSHLKKWLLEADVEKRSALLFYLANNSRIHFDGLDQCLQQQSKTVDAGIQALLLRLLAMRQDLQRPLSDFLDEMLKSPHPGIRKRALSIHYAQSFSEKAGLEWSQSLDLKTPEDFASILLHCDQYGPRLPQDLLFRLKSALSSAVPSIRLNAALALTAAGSLEGLLYLIDEIDTPKKILFKEMGTLPYWKCDCEKDLTRLSTTSDAFFFQNLLLAYLPRHRLDAEELLEAVDQFAMDQDFTKAQLALQIATHLSKKDQISLYKKWTLQPRAPFLRIAALSSLLNIDSGQDNNLLSQLREELKHAPLPTLSLPFLIESKDSRNASLQTDSQKRLVMQVQWQIYKEGLMTLFYKDREPQEFITTLFQETQRSDLRLFLSKLYYEKFSRSY